MPRATPCRLFLAFPAPWALLLLATTLSGCWFDSAAQRLNKKIDAGNAVEALSTLEDKLANNPEDPAFNLLAIKARLQVCLQRACFTETALPPLLQPLPKLASHVNGPVVLKDELPPLALQGVLAEAINSYAAHTRQPAAVIALYANTPKAQQAQTAEALFLPALHLLRHGKAAEASTFLTTLAGSKQAEIPATYTYAAATLAAIVNHQDLATNPSLIALRSSTKPPLPGTAAAVLPWAFMARHTTDKNAPLTTLDTLPARLAALQLPDVLNAAALAALTRELVTTSRQPQALAQWQQGSGAPTTLVQLRLQQTALELNPNQPDLWATYLPTLVSHTLLTKPSNTEVAAPTFAATAITSATAPKLAALIMPAVRKLADYPAIAAPLLTFTGKLALSNPQQVEYQKLSQDILLKASTLGDISSTLLIAQSLPDVAQNNRHSVVPLLVGYIRQQLRDGNFEAATATAGLLTQTLRMDVEFDPLILEEFTEDLSRRKILAELNAPTPHHLFATPHDATLDLGPLFTFMQQHFQNQPKVISGQLTTLIAKAEGTYGQATAMYRLGSYFPESTLSPQQQAEWLGAALEQALLADTTLSATTLAETAARLAELHPGLNLAPVMETALKRAESLEDQRTLWHNATPRMREVLRAIRPQFTQLMNGVDALQAHRLNEAARAFAELTQPQWRSEAAPFLEQFHQRLVSISGIYVPVSGAATTKTAAILLQPQGLSGNGKLNMVSVTFLSRGGHVTESEPQTMRTNGMAVHRATLALPYNFDTATLALDVDTLAHGSQDGHFGTTYGALRGLKLQAQGSGATLLTVSDAGGTQTTYLRTLLDPTAPLRPDGTYLIQTALGKPEASTAAILPQGSLFTFSTAATPALPPTGADTTAHLIYPLEGQLRHPAAAQEIAFTGYFDPTLLLTTFTFHYPLPASGQPAAATVRCQTLAGPITCGMHHQNSARQAYATRVSGMQTRESMANAATLRDVANAASAVTLLSQATRMPEPETTPQPTAHQTQPTTVSLSAPLSATTLTDSHTTSPTSNDTPAIPPFQPEASPNSPSLEPEPGAFINNSGARFTSPTQIGPQQDIEPGEFIDLTGRSTTSPTTP